MKKASRRRVDVNVDELDRIIDGAMREPLNETDGQTLKTALHAMAERLVRGRNTEKISSVLGNDGTTAPPDETQPEASENKPAGHGRNGANAFRGAEKVKVAHPNLQTGNRCPDCGRGNVYEQKDPGCWCGSWVRLRSQLRSMNWNDCAATPVGRSLRRRNRRAWGRRSTTRPPLR